MLAVLITVFLLNGPPDFLLAGQELDENELFSDENTVVDSREVIRPSVASNAEKESTAFSGNIYNVTTYDMKRSWVQGRSSPEANTFFTYLEGNALLDIRLRKGIKAFVDLSAYYSPQGRMNVLDLKEVQFTNNRIGTNRVTYLEEVKTVVILKEFFLDTVIARKIYLRAGKQVLQWGRGYFWNPADLINRDRKSFLEMEKYREGVFGTKVHVPFGTTANVYGFLDFTDAAGISSMAASGKLEFLVYNTEAAFSSWAGKGSEPVYGFDFSTRVFTMDFYGEMSASPGERKPRLKIERTPVMPGMILTNYSAVQESGRWKGRFCLGLSRSFDWTIPDRILVTGEFYYNGEGYAGDMLEDPKTRSYFLSGGFYEANEYGLYYGALFITINRIFIEELSLNLSGLANFSDQSMLLSALLNYSPTYNFNFGFGLIGAAGGADREYTMSGNSLSLQLTASIDF